MAGGYSGIRYLQVGATSTPDGTPGAYSHVDPHGEISIPIEHGKVPITAQQSDGEITAPALGVKSGSISFACLLRGRGTAAGDGATAAPPGDLDVMLDSVSGMSGQHGVGDTTGASNSTTVLTLADTSLFFDGKSGTEIASGVALTCGSYYELREIETVTANTSLTVDRALPSAPADSAVINAMTSWIVDADKGEHGYVDAKFETETFARRLYGCGFTAKISAPPGAQATIAFDGQANNWADLAEESPTYSSPGGSAPLNVEQCRFFIGSTAYKLISAEIDLGLAVQPIVASSGPNGQYGWVWTYSGAKMTGRLYHAELTDAVVATLRTATTQDVALQIGDRTSSATLGNGVYIRIPAASFKITGDGTAQNGLDAIDFEITATRPASGKGSIRIHLAGKAA